MGACSNGELALLSSQVRDLIADLAAGGRAAGARGSPTLPAMLEAMKESGFLGVPVPERYGGDGGGWLETAILIEEAAAVEPGLAAMLTAHFACISGILLMAGESGRQLLVPPLARCEFIGGVALTEPEAGTDLSALRTRLEKREGNLLINGNKCFVTNTDPEFVSGILTFCVSEHGSAAVYIPSSSPGFHLAHRYRFAGWDNLPNHAIVLQDCLLPYDHLVKEGIDSADLEAFFNAPRLMVSAMALGISRACMEEVSSYTRERRQCGVMLVEHQSVRFRLADIATSIEVQKTGLRHAAHMLDAEQPCSYEINILKLFSTSQLEQVVSTAMEMAGGYGYTVDSKLSRLFRDAKGLQLYWGSRERMRMDIAGALDLGPPR